MAGELIITQREQMFLLQVRYHDSLAEVEYSTVAPVSAWAAHELIFENLAYPQTPAIMTAIESHIAKQST